MRSTARSIHHWCTGSSFDVATRRLQLAAIRYTVTERERRREKKNADNIYNYQEQATVLLLFITVNYIDQDLC